MVGAIDAVVLPDHRFHLGRGLVLGQLPVVVGHVDDGRAQRRVICRCRPGRLLQGRAFTGMLVGDAGSAGAGDEGEARDRPARAQADQRGRLLPPGLAGAVTELTFFRDCRAGSTVPGTVQIALSGGLTG